MQKCHVCGLDSHSKCSNCFQAFYCSPNHQKQDWKTHKYDCHPFKIARDDTLGRFLVATRDIKPFEIVIKEQPLLRGPSQITDPVCLGCLNSVNENFHTKCVKCGLPFCDEKCKDNPEHEAECNVIAQSGVKIEVKNFDSQHPLYKCISVIRCLNWDKVDPANFKKLMELESLEHERRGSLQYKIDLENIGKLIPKLFKTELFTEEQIMKFVGILQINGHEIPSTEPTHVAIYYLSSLLEHSCIPNLAKSFTSEGNIVIWSPKTIKKGDHLTICYADASWEFHERQIYLLHTKHFKCNCLRCQDESELGTFYSAFKCQYGDCNGFVMLTKPKAGKPVWKCNTCSLSESKKAIECIREKAKKDYQVMKDSIEGAIKFLNYYGKWFSPQHFFVSEMKMQLIQHISNNNKGETETPDTSEKLLHLKIQYCKELIDLYEMLLPCDVRILGIICFELHSSLTERARTNNCCAEKANDDLKESLYFAKKCVTYLQHESPQFTEGIIFKQAQSNIAALKINYEL